MVDDGAGRPERLRARGARRATARCARVVETKGDGDATPEELEIREVNAGIYVFDGGRAAGGAAAAERRERPGRAVPAAGARPAARRRAGGGRARGRGPEPGAGVNDRVALAGCAALAQQAIHERHMRAGVSIVDPAATVIDVDVQIGAGHDDRAVHRRSGAHRGSAPAAPVRRTPTSIDCVLEDAR